MTNTLLQSKALWRIPNTDGTIGSLGIDTYANSLWMHDDDDNLYVLYYLTTGTYRVAFAVIPIDYRECR